MDQQEILIETVKIRKGEKPLLREGDLWSDTDRQILQREYYNGTSYNEIAIMLQRSEGAIHQQVERMGLCTRNPFLNVWLNFYSKHEKIVYFTQFFVTHLEKSATILICITYNSLIF